MTLTHILIFTLANLLIGWVASPRSRGWLLLAGSLVAIYWMQPSTPIRNLDFWLPTASILLTVFVWAVTQRSNPSTGLAAKPSLLAVLAIPGFILAVGLTRYLGPACCLTPSPPPEWTRIVLFLSVGSAAAVLPRLWMRNRRWMPSTTILVIVGLFVILKSEVLAQLASAGVRSLTGQDVSLASGLDLRWLGFSYLAFRLLHAVRDYQLGKLPSYTLGEFVTYAIFYPAFTAGPIDRSQHFVGELRRTSEAQAHTLPMAEADLSRIGAGLQRILIGVFKKFALADSLALIALNGQNAGQVQSASWMWVLLYAYTLRIYFDFSGYTDIALGLARLVGITLPENFDRPYLKTNLTAFWNSWHITLAQWFRAYFFNPVTRLLRMRADKIPVWSVILMAQVGTMLLIGLWHGITWNFIVWGLWHGAGLFIHNRWLEWGRSHAFAPMGPRVQRIAQVGGWFLTFHYVVLGWVWFALPDMQSALLVFQKLAGFHG